MPRKRRSISVLIAVTAAFAVAGLTGLALATSSSSPTLGAVQNATIGKTIAVDSRGITVYELSPETTHHLLCTRANGCFAFWPPVTVSSAKTKLTAAAGIKAKLGILHRNGVFQVTLAGRPLYRFAGDASKRGKAGGQGLHGFGGTWHVVTASAQQSTMTTTMSTPTTSSTRYPGY